MRIFLATPSELHIALDIERHILSEGYELSSAPRFSRHVSSETVAAIMRSDLCVAVIGPAEDHVMFELGLAAGAGVPTLIVIVSGTAVPVDLAEQRFIAFGDDLAQDLQRLGLVLAELESANGPPLTSSHRDRHTAGAVRRDLQLAETLTEAEFEALARDLFLRLGFRPASFRVPLGGPDLVLQGPIEGLLICELKRRGTGGLVPGEAVRQAVQYRQDLQASHAVLVSDGSYTRAARELAQETDVLLLTLPDLLAAERPEDVLRLPKSRWATGPGSDVSDRGSTIGVSGGEQSRESDSVTQFLELHSALQRALPADAADPYSIRMLLQLEQAEREKRPMPVSTLCINSGMAPTSALRWLSRLEGAGAVFRRQDVNDHRRSFIVITPEISAIITQVMQGSAIGSTKVLARPEAPERG